jgi:hypothetical protein
MLMVKVLSNIGDIHEKQLPGIYVLQTHLVFRMCLLIVSNKHKLWTFMAHKLMSAISSV